jgi:N utilization substance protein B
MPCGVKGATTRGCASQRGGEHFDQSSEETGTAEMGSQGPRRQAREAAVQVLYAADLAGRLGVGEIEPVFQQVLREFDLPRRAQERARKLVTGVAANAKAIDERIELASDNWRVGRLATVDRNVLRIATFELLLESETPPAVVIDEAVEIARRYGGAESPAFVNGVLDRIARAGVTRSPA